MGFLHKIAKLFQTEKTKTQALDKLGSSTSVFTFMNEHSNLVVEDLLLKLEKIEQRFEYYRETPIIGGIARQALAELKLTQHKYPVILLILDSRFSNTSLTYEKFASAVEATVSTIAENSETLLKKITLFDVDEYKELRKLIASGIYKEDGIPNDVQEERFKLLRDNRDVMASIIEANERLLLELDRFSVNASKIPFTSVKARSEEMTAELKRLADEMKFYI